MKIAWRLSDGVWLIDSPSNGRRLWRSFLLGKTAERPGQADAFNNFRSTFPRSFLGNDGTNSIQRGYLYAASFVFTNCLISLASASSAPVPSRATINAFGLTRPSP